MKIHEKLKKIRTDKGITQTYIAKKIGKTPGWYSNIERGKRGLSAEDAKKIAAVLEVDMNEIFFENGLNTTFNPEKKDQQTA